MWAELRDHGPEDWGPFGAERLRLSTRLVIWVTLAVLFLVDALLALGDTGVTSSSELPQLAAGYVLIGLMVLHTPLGVVAIVLALVLGDRWWDHDAISLLFAGAATILGMSARLPLILVSGSFFVVWLVVAGRVLDRLSPVSASLLAFSAVGGSGPRAGAALAQPASEVGGAPRGGPTRPARTGAERRAPPTRPRAPRRGRPRTDDHLDAGRHAADPHRPRPA